MYGSSERITDMLNQEDLDSLKRKFQFYLWTDDNTLQSELFIWNFFLTDSEFIGWIPSHIQIKKLDNESRLINSIWQKSQVPSATSFNIDIVECSSRKLAHEHLIQNLANYSAPLNRLPSKPIGPRRTTEIGDVAFANHNASTLFFVRANLAVKINSLENESIHPIALRLDEKFASSPRKLIENMVYPVEAINDVSSANIKIDEAIPLSIPDTDLRGQPVWYKLFSRSGTFKQVGGDICFLANSSGKHDIYIFAINPNIGIEKQRLQIRI